MAGKVPKKKSSKSTAASRKAEGPPARKRAARKSKATTTRRKAVAGAARASKAVTRKTGADASPTIELDRAREKRYVDELIRRVVEQCPRRQPTSDDESRALDIFLEELRAAGLETSEHSFRFNDSLYKNLVLHSGLGVAGTAVSGIAPLAGLGMHLLAAGSYWADSTRKAYILRRLFPFKPSRNVMGVLPAEDEPALRIVFLGHADAAFTGMTFWPSLVKLSAKETHQLLRPLRRGVQLMVTTQLMLAGIDAMRVLLGPLTLPLRPLEYLLTLPSLISLVLNGHVVLKNEIVPGANDNLSGSAALPVLARRLAPEKRPDVEYVFCVTGCEEASLGGADALAREMEGVWDKDRTIFIALDSISNGDLHFLETEGEIRPRKIPAWLSETIMETAGTDPRFQEIKGYEVPVGGSDAAALQAHGWTAVGLTCLHPDFGSPEHYHLPSDTPENLDVDKVVFSIDFAETLAKTLISRRLG